MRSFLVLIVLCGGVLPSWALPNPNTFRPKPSGPKKEWVLALQEGTAEEQIKAAIAITNEGDKGIVYLAVLRDAFQKTESPLLRANIARAFSAIGPAASEVLPMIEAEFQKLSGTRATDFANALLTLTRGDHPEALRWSLSTATEGRSKQPFSIRLHLEQHPKNVIPLLGDNLQDSKYVVASRAVRNLRSAAMPRDSKTPPLTAALSVEQRYKLIQQLRAFYRQSNQAISMSLWRCQAGEVALRLDPTLLNEVLPLYITRLHYSNLDASELAALLTVAPAALPQLLATLGDTNDTYREHLMSSFQDLHTPYVCRTLVQHLKHRNPRVREGVLALAEEQPQIGKAIVADVGFAVHDDSPDVRLKAATLWVTHKPNLGVQVLPTLLELANSGDQHRRNIALRYISKIGKPARSAMPTLMRLTRHAELSTRYLAAEALQGVDPLATATFVRPFTEMVNEHSSDDCEKAIVHLGECGPAAKSALPTLRTVLDVETLRVHAFTSMWKIDPQTTPEVLKGLREIIKGDDADVLTAMDTLAKMGPAAKVVVPELLKIMAEQEDEEFASKAACTAILLDPKEAELAYQRFRSVLADPGGVPITWYERLEDLGPAAKPLLPELIAALQSKRTMVRRTAALALGNLGADAKDALPALRALVSASTGGAAVNEATKKIEAALKKQ